MSFSPAFYEISDEVRNWAEPYGFGPDRDGLCRWFHRHDLAAVAADTTWGLTQGQNCDLEALSKACESSGDTSSCWQPTLSPWWALRFASEPNGCFLIERLRATGGCTCDLTRPSPTSSCSRSSPRKS